MATLSSLEITGYRSIQGPITVRFPRSQPLVLIGENNAGKSNIVRAFDMVLGQRWTGSHDPEDHEFYNRNRDGAIQIRARFDREDLLAEQYSEARWTFNVVDRGEASHQVGPSQYGRAYDWMSNAAKSDCTCVVIAADRNLGYELSYKSKFTFLSRLMHQFHKALSADEAVKGDLEELFATVRERFDQIQPFAEFTRALQEKLGGFGGAMTHRLEVDFQAYNPVNFFHALRLHAREGTTPRSLEELGTGEQQILALSFAYAFAAAFHEGLVLVIEEPESHLHPLAQEWLARRISDMCDGGLQIVLTTHSPHFINILNLDGIALVQKGADGTRAVQITVADLVRECVASGVPEDRISEENVLGFYSAVVTPEILEGFFAKVVVLVEGPTEALALPIYLEKCDLVPARDGIAVIPVGGKGNLGKWRRLFTAYGIPTFVVFDNDGRSDDRDGRKRRDALAAMGVAENEREDILALTEWEVASSYMVFPENFEESLRATLAGYEGAEAVAATEGIDAKPFVARFVAHRLEPNDEDLGWERLREFAARVLDLTPPVPVAPPAPPADAGKIPRHDGVARPAARPD